MVSERFIFSAVGLLIVASNLLLSCRNFEVEFSFEKQRVLNNKMRLESVRVHLIAKESMVKTSTDFNKTESHGIPFENFFQHLNTL